MKLDYEKCAIKRLKSDKCYGGQSQQRMVVISMNEITYDDVVKYWKSMNISNGTDLDAAVNGMAVLLAYHTTKLEEPEVSFDDTREIFEHGRVVGYTGDIKDLFALRNAKNELFSGVTQPSRCHNSCRGS